MRPLLLSIALFFSAATFGQPPAGTRILSYFRYFNDTASSVFDSSFYEKYDLGAYRVFVTPIRYSESHEDSLLVDSTRYRYFIHSADSSFGMSYYSDESSRIQREAVDSALKYFPHMLEQSFDSLFRQNYKLLRSESNKDSGTLHMTYYFIDSANTSSGPTTLFFDFGKQPQHIPQSKGILGDLEKKFGLRMYGYRIVSNLECASIRVDIRHTESPVAHIPANILAMVERYKEKSLR